MRSSEIFRTRSFNLEPFGTAARTAEWMLRSWSGISRSYDIQFGPHRFKLQLQAAKRGYGSAGAFILRQYYEPLLEFGYKLLNTGDGAIDGGANQGLFTCAFAAAVGPAGQVYAFEPQAYAVSCIRRNSALNSFNNVTVFEAALTDATGTTFLVTGVDPISAFATAREQPNTIPVWGVAIDDLVSSKQIGDVHLLKLDLEGGELRGLRGAQHMLTRSKPQICVEALDKGLYEQITEFLSLYKYKPYVFDGRGNLNILPAFAPSANVFFLQ